MNQKTQTRNREILTGCKAIVIGFCETQTKTFVEAGSEYLFEQANKAKADNDQRRYFEARQFLEDNQNKLTKHFENHVKTQFKTSFSDKPQQQNKVHRQQNNDDDLSLIEESEMEITVAINSMSHRIESECADELFGLAQRFAILNKGVKLDEDLSPYSPKSFCYSFVEYIGKDSHELSIDLLLLKLFEKSFVRNLIELYKEINRYLISANVLTNLRHTAKAMVEPRRRKTDQFTLDSEQRQAELYQSIGSMINSNATPIDPQQPMMSVEQAILELNNLQQQQRIASQDNLFNQAAAPNIPNTNVQPLQQALECVSMLFDIVRSEEGLGDPVKNLLGHLHTPYAKVALADPTFLANPEHDARQLFSAIVHASEQWTDSESDSTSEIVQRIKTVVEKITAEVTDDKHVEMHVFGELLSEFSSYVEAFERKVKLTEQRNIQAAEGREKLKENQLKVDELIKSKIHAESLPKPVSALIADAWSSYLTYTLLRHGEKSSEWDEAIGVIDNVLWYIEPKTSKKENAMADAIRDKLHVALELGMQNVGLDASDIKTKLSALDLCRQLATENAASHSEPQNTTDHQEDKPSKNAAMHNEQHSSTVPDDAPSTDGQAVILASEQNEAAAQSITQPTSQSTSKKNKSDSKNRIQQQKMMAQGKGNTTLNNITTAKNSHSKDTDNIVLDRDPMLDQLAESLHKNSESQAVTNKRTAPKAQIDEVLSLKFGTWLDWNKPGEIPQQVKLTWYNSRTKNCMLSNSRGKEIAVVTANTIALGIQDGWIKKIEKTRKKPLFERMFETISGRNQASEYQANQPKYQASKSR